jgi:hypothetical protein
LPLIGSAAPALSSIGRRNGPRQQQETKTVSRHAAILSLTAMRPSGWTIARTGRGIPRGNPRDRNSVFAPPPDVVERLELICDLREATVLHDRLWTEVKTGR